MTKTSPISNNPDDLKRPVLPPISSMDGFNRSWITNPISPTSTTSTTSPRLLQDTAELWSSTTGSASSLNYRKEQSRTDYFTDNLSKERLSSSSSGSSAAAITTVSSGNGGGDNFRYERPVELILTPSSFTSTSLFSVEKDIDQVIRQSSLLSDNMTQRRNPILKQQYDHPWLDEMINQANDVLNALIRLRKHQLAASDYVPEHHEAQEERDVTEGGRGATGIAPPPAAAVAAPVEREFLQQDIRRKRGRRAAFQGRCHSCNISETPEWRRGPDGARTLCNACGLHYAKLARKKAGKDVRKGSLEDTAMK